MGLVQTLIFGRENGIRRALFRALTGGEASSPAAPEPASSADAEPRDVEVAKERPEAPRDVTPPEGYEVVLHTEGLLPGEIGEVIIAGTAIAVANVDGTFYAIQNECPHAEGPLGEGTLNGTQLTCPYHGWQFDVSTGDCLVNPEAKIQTYAVAIEGEAVCVKL
jgi:nitrite reductase (NADH) small subunit